MRFCGFKHRLSILEDPAVSLIIITRLNTDHQLILSHSTHTHTHRIPSNHQEPAYYDTCNPISQLISTGGNGKSTTNQMSDQIQQSLSVEDWLNSIKMSRYRENFQRHQINSLQYVARLSQADLNLIGIQNGQHLKKILTAITSLRSTTSIGACGEGYLV